MKYVNKNVLSASDNASTNGSQIDADQLYSSSFHAYFGDATASGTFKIQASNDLAPTHYTANTNFTVTNWTDIPNATASVTSGTSALIMLPQGASYRWLRSVYTDTAAAVQTIAPIADVMGGLNNSYFLISDANDVNKYAMYMDVGGTGTAPVVAGYTSVAVPISAGNSAASVGTALATAISALNGAASFSATGTTLVTVTNLVGGPFTPMSDGAIPTTFTFVTTVGGTSTINVNFFGVSV